MKYLAYFLCTIVAGIILVIVSKSDRKAEEQMNPEEFTMRLPKVYTWVFVGSLIAFIVLAVISYKDKENIIIMIVVFGGFILVSLMCIIGCLKFRLFIKGYSMTYIGMFGKEIEIPYSCIQKIKVTQQGVKVKTEVKNFSLDRNTVGLNLFLILMHKKGIEITG